MPMSHDLSNMRILVVDDETSVCNLVKTILQHSGFVNVQMAASAAEAYSHARSANGETVDLVVLDVVLPDQNGYDLCARLKREFDPELPVLLMSGVNLESSHARYVEAGADDFIAKPFRPDEMLTRVKMLLERRRQRQMQICCQTVPIDMDALKRKGMVNPGDRIGSYTFEEILWWGGSAIIGCVRSDAGQRYALKMLVQRAAEHEDVVARFRDEVQLLQSLEHPNIIKVYASGTHVNCPYFVMELLTAPNVNSYLQQRQRLNFNEIFAIAAGVAQALAYVHQHNIVHRDVTLKNMFYCPKTQAVKLTDFGISARRDGIRHTREGIAVATPLYMAPETIYSPELSTAADIYSFGACIYHLIAGDPPFTADNMFALAQKHLHTPPISLCRQRRGVSSAWDEFITGKCLAKRAAQRPHNMHQVLTTLEELHHQPFSNE